MEDELEQLMREQAKFCQETCANWIVRINRAKHLRLIHASINAVVPLLAACWFFYRCSYWSGILQSLLGLVLAAYGWRSYGSHIKLLRVFKGQWAQFRQESQERLEAHIAANKWKHNDGTDT